ncbi:MAG: branched-chain amino acid ABC transporter permease [candidate division WOR-3 bacterium]|nr:branched-chain amino acid ABC transporter permease [candidate division WOR-3 bacterium]
MGTEFIQQIFNGLIIGFTYALMAVGLTMIFGIMRIVNFAHGEFYMLGAFAVYTFVALLKVNYFISLFLSVSVVVLVALACERFLLRRVRLESEAASLLVTIALSVLFQNIVLLGYGAVPRSVPSPFSPIPLAIGCVSLNSIRLFSVITTAIIILVIHLLIQKTRLGMAVRATFQDREAASLVGVSIDRIYFFIFGLGCGLAAVGGALLGSVFLVYPSMGELVIAKSFVVVIMAGMGNFPGAVFSGLILGVAESLGAGFVSSGYKDAIGFVIVIFVLLLRPSGLFGKLKEASR